MELERKKIQRALYFVVYALLPVGIFYLMEAYEHNALLEVRTEAQFCWHGLYTWQLGICAQRPV